MLQNLKVELLSRLSVLESNTYACLKYEFDVSDYGEFGIVCGRLRSCYVWVILEEQRLVVTSFVSVLKVGFFQQSRLKSLQ